MRDTVYTKYAQRDDLHRMTPFRIAEAGPGEVEGQIIYCCQACRQSLDDADTVGLEEHAPEWLPPRRCYFCGTEPFVYDEVEAGYRDARPDCP